MYPNYLGENFLSTLFAQIDARKKQQLKDQAGITSIGGYEGIERLNIPHKYDRINVGGKYFSCICGYRTTIYNIEGKFILEADQVEYLKDGMFLVGNAVLKEADKKGFVPDRQDYAYALYNENHKLTEDIFKPYGMEKGFNEYGFLIVGIFGVFWKKAVINKTGDILFESDGSDSIYLHGVICSIKKKYINLLTGNVICEGGYDTISTDDFIFSKIEQNCVYQISIKTGDYIIHGIPPKPKEDPKKVERPVPAKKIEPEPKRRRNDLCHCGSGKKFKHCCI